LHITRDLFQILATAILGAIACVWFLVEEPQRTIPLIILVSLFVLLSLEYVREGFSQKKSEASPDITGR